MAYLGVRKTGARYIQFKRGGKLVTLGLGVIGKSKAETIKRRVEDLVLTCKTGTVLEDVTKKWLMSIDRELRDKLVGAGLLAPGAGDVAGRQLGAFVERCLEAKLRQYKPGSVRVRRHSQRALVEFFGEGRDIGTITEADAEAYRDWLLTEFVHRRRKTEQKGMSEAVTRKRCGDAKMWFAVAVKMRLIDSNPFDVVPVAAVAGENKVFVDEVVTERVMEKLPGPQWRLLYGLARFQGMRIPSEIQGMKWEHVDWERKRLVVLSPKTERHRGHDRREMPIFPETMELLREVFECAPEGVSWVLPMARGKTGAAFRKPLLRAIELAGLEAWPKLYQMLRSTRQTELEHVYPSHVVCAWLGNSVKVAAKHYLQVTDGYFEAASNSARNGARIPLRSEGVTDGANSGLEGDRMRYKSDKNLSMNSAGLEPATCGSVNRCSIQLSYES